MTCELKNGDACEVLGCDERWYPAVYIGKRPAGGHVVEIDGCYSRYIEVRPLELVTDALKPGDACEVSDNRMTWYGDRFFIGTSKKGTHVAETKNGGVSPWLHVRPAAERVTRYVNPVEWFKYDGGCMVKLGTSRLACHKIPITLTRRGDTVTVEAKTVELD